MNTYLTDEEYDFIYSRVPRICVDLVIRSKGGILLTKRDIEPYKDHWHFPGGRIKFRETAEDAITRIMKGELGNVIDSSPKLIGFCQFLEEVQNGHDRHSVSLVHLIEIESDIQVKLDHTTKDFRFFDSLPEVMIPMQKDFCIKNNLLK